MFPEAAGAGEKARSIPELPGRKILSLALFTPTAAGRRQANRAVEEGRMAHIARYVNELIKLEPSVSQSVQVLSFFDNDWFKLHPQRKSGTHAPHP